MAALIGFFVKNAATVIVLLVLVLVLTLVAVLTVRAKKRRGGSCSCGCGGCPMRDACHKATDGKTEK